MTSGNSSSGIQSHNCTVLSPTCTSIRELIAIAPIPPARYCEHELLNEQAR
jgi:hypothetical protein